MTRNTLGLSERELESVITKLDEEQLADGKRRRAYVRWKYPREVVVLRIDHPGGSEVSLPLAGRNLSRDGISLLHSSYVHPGSTCMVRLRHLYKGVVEETGEIIRCDHKFGRVHEVGINFDRLIQTRDYLDFDPMAECYSIESVEPRQLKGRVLVIDDDDLECRLIGKHLEGTPLECVMVQSVDDAMDKAAENFDVILCDYHLDGSLGTELIRLMRAQGSLAPVVMVTCDKSTQSRADMRQAGAGAFVSKPIDRDRLLRAIAEFLLSDGDGGPLHSTLIERDSMFDLVGPFVDGLMSLVSALDTALSSGDAAQCRVLCMRLGSQAPPMGFRELGLLAEDAARALDAATNVRECDAELQRLLTTARRVRQRPAA